MNLEVVSVESPVSVASPQEKPEAAGGHRVQAKSIPSSNEPPSFDAAHKQAIIKDAQYRMARQGLFAAEHGHDHLMELCRRNCRPNTLRSRFGTILVFLQYLKAKSRHLLELICREDLCAFIEHEQDRGLKPASVSNRIDGLYAFIRFLVDREVLGADLLKRKLRVKVPDSLPRAIDPQDVRRLLAVTLRPRDRAMVLVLLRTGMRIGVLLHTTLADVNLAERRIEIVETQKNRVGRVVYLAEDAIVYISRIHQTDPSKPIFIKYAPGAMHADSGDFRLKCRRLAILVIFEGSSTGSLIKVMHPDVLQDHEQERR